MRSLATLSDSQFCRARLPLADGATICISNEAWVGLLESETAPCGSWLGHWKLRRPIDAPGIPERAFSARSLVPAARCGRGLLPLERLRQHLSQILSSTDPLGIARSLLLGESVSGPGALVRVLGFVHVLRASGIHLYALALGWSFLLSWVARSAGVPQRMGLRLARAGAWLAWTGAWALAGAPAGMLRPLLLVGIRTWAKNRGIAWRRWAPLAVALAIDLAVAIFRSLQHIPSAWAPGRWLYALCVAGGMIALESGGRARHLSLAIGSWALPAVGEAYSGGLISVFTPLLSTVTVPCICVFVYPLLLASALADAAGLARIGDALTASGARAATALVSPLAGLLLVLPSLWLVPKGALATGAFLALGLRAALRARARALVAIAGLILLGRAEVRAPRPNGPAIAKVTQLDVGQGDSALVETGSGRAGLIDAGPERARSAAGWIRSLAPRGVRSLEWIALTHLDADHRGGLAELARLLPVGCVSVPRGELETPRGAAFRAELSRLGVRIADWSAGGCVPFPHAELSGTGHNSRMGAILVPLSGQRYYLSAGDAEGEMDEAFARWARARVDNAGGGAVLLKISHHGSSTSSSGRVLATLAPAEAWISVGEGNVYRHPSSEVLARLERSGIPLRRTDRDGELSSEK